MSMKRNIISTMIVIAALALDVQAQDVISLGGLPADSLSYDATYSERISKDTNPDEVTHSERAKGVTTGSVTNVVKGDVDGDGLVDGSDIQTVINCIFGDMYNENADVNGDYVISGTDIQEIILIIVETE